MRCQAVARREKERRRPNLCLPRLRQEVLRREWNLPRIVEVDDADDRENDNADYAGLPELDGFLDTRNRSENRSVLVVSFSIFFNGLFFGYWRLRILISMAVFVFLVT